MIQHACSLQRAKDAALHVSPELLDWSSAGRLQTIVEYEIGGGARKISVRPMRGSTYEVADGAAVRRVAVIAIDSETVRLTVDGASLDVTYREDGRTIWLATAERSVELVNLASFARSKADKAGQGALLAPMHGKLLDVCVAEGDRVKRGDRLAVLEAMKMQHELSAGVDGHVKRIAAAKGSQIAARTLILEIEPLEGGAS